MYMKKNEIHSGDKGGGGGGARLLVHLWTYRQILYDLLDCRDNQEKV